MRILIAEDELISRCVLEDLLNEWGHEVQAVGDGLAAWQALKAEGAPQLAILDWRMPGLEGVEICRRMRAARTERRPYLLLLTARDARSSIVEGLRAGANDYVTKPFDPEELKARVDAGVQLIELQESLAARVRELEVALAEVKQLGAFLPICSYCKKIRDDQNYWQQVENYISEHVGVRFSHGICPECYESTIQSWRAEQAAGAREAHLTSGIP